MPENIEWITLITLIFATNFSPGPVLLTTTSLGILYGFKKAIKFCNGVFFGYTILMLFTAFAAGTLMKIFPNFQLVVRIAGGLYIGWLAISTYRKSFQVDVHEQPALGFKEGLLMQFVNVKGMVFGLTLFSSLLAPLQANVVWQVLGAVGLALSAYAATITYAGLGSVIRRFLSNERARRAVSIILSLALLYVALRISGLLDWLVSLFS